MSEKTIHMDPEMFASNFVNSIDVASLGSTKNDTEVKSELAAQLTQFVGQTLAKEDAIREINRQKAARLDGMSAGRFLELISSKLDFSANI